MSVNRLTKTKGAMPEGGLGKGLGACLGLMSRQSYLLLVLVAMLLHSGGVWALGFPATKAGCHAVGTFSDFTGQFDSNAIALNSIIVTSPTSTIEYACPASALPSTRSWAVLVNGVVWDTASGQTDLIATTVPGIALRIHVSGFIRVGGTNSITCNVPLTSISQSTQSVGCASPTNARPDTIVRVAFSLIKTGPVPSGTFPVRLLTGQLIIQQYGINTDATSAILPSISNAYNCNTREPDPAVVEFPAVARGGIPLGPNQRVLAAAPQRVTVNGDCSGQIDVQAHPVMVTFTATSGAHNVVAGTLQTTMPDFFLRFADTPNGAPYLNFGTPYQIGTYPANPAPIFDRVYSKDYYWSLFHDSTVAQGGFGDWTATATYEITYQ